VVSFLKKKGWSDLQGNHVGAVEGREWSSSSNGTNKTRMKRGTKKVKNIHPKCSLIPKEEPSLLWTKQNARPTRQRADR